MAHPLTHLTSTTPGIVEVWITDLLEPTDQTRPFSVGGQLLKDTSLCAIGSLRTADENQYVISLSCLNGYIRGLFDAYQTRGFQVLPQVYLRNVQDNVMAVFDCRRFLKTPQPALSQGN